MQTRNLSGEALGCTWSRDPLGLALHGSGGRRRSELPVSRIESEAWPPQSLKDCYPALCRVLPSGRPQHSRQRALSQRRLAGHPSYPGKAKSLTPLQGAPLLASLPPGAHPKEPSCSLKSQASSTPGPLYVPVPPSTLRMLSPGSVCIAHSPMFQCHLVWATAPGTHPA